VEKKCVDAVQTIIQKVQTDPSEQWLCKKQKKRATCKKNNPSLYQTHKTVLRRSQNHNQPKKAIAQFNAALRERESW